MFIYNCNVHTTEKVSRRIQLRATEKYTIGKEKKFVAGDKSPSMSVAFCHPDPPLVLLLESLHLSESCFTI